MTPATITVNLIVREATSHRAAELGRKITEQAIELDRTACLMRFWAPTGYETRPGFPAIEAELKRRGFMPLLPYGQVYCYSLVS